MRHPFLRSCVCRYFDTQVLLYGFNYAVRVFYEDQMDLVGQHRYCYLICHIVILSKKINLIS